ncbi:hypothetical protein PS907_04683 [Pseudomonas fluorescens]|nr:hypothetical protein PS907_04683 [Pseudomonas fluorescens]
MFDLSLLIGLPKPNSIHTALLTPEDAAINYCRLPLFGLMEQRVFCFIVRKTLSSR